MTRRYLTAKQKAELVLSQKGLCACGCGAKLEPGKIEFDHIKALYIDGDNSLENFRALTTTCHKAKTAKDAKDRAKIKRLLWKFDPDERKKRRAKKRKIQGKGFDRKWRKKLNGKTEKREGRAVMA